MCEFPASVPSVDGGGGVFSDAGEAQKGQEAAVEKYPGREKKAGARLGCQATFFAARRMAFASRVARFVGRPT